MQAIEGNSREAKRVLPSILATAIFMQMLDSTILNTSLPAIAKDLNESPLEMQNAIISYVLTLAIFMPVSGFLADRLGTRTVFTSAVFMFSLGSLFCALSTSLTLLVISRVVQGLGGALMNPVGRLALMKTFEKDQLVRALNFAIIPALIGPILGPLVGGYIVNYFSWHWIFLINIPIGILGIVLGLRFMPDYKDDENRFDLKGFFIFALSSLFLSLALEFLGNTQNVTPVLLVFTFGFLMLYFYYRYAQKTDNPIFPLELFQVRTFRIGIIGNLATRLGISAIPLLIPLMIQVAYKQSAVVSGWIVAPMALTSIFAKQSVLRILNRLGYRLTLRLNTAIIGLLILSLAIPGIDTSIYWFIPIIAVLGFFNSIQFTAMNTISIADLRTSQTSSGNSLLSVNQQLAVGFGISLGLVVLKLFDGGAGQSVSHAHAAFRYTFLVFGILTIFSGLVFRRLHIKDGLNLMSDRGEA